jgi:hypothetical protein
MPTIIFGGGKIDITDRPDRTLGILNVNSNIANFTDLFNTCFKITVDGSKVVASDSTSYVGNIKRIYYNVPILEFINNPPNANLGKKYILELDGIIQNVNDDRHSQNLDLEDSTYYGDTSGTLQLDYGSVITFKQIYIKCETTSANTKFYIDISQDGSTWTNIFYFEKNKVHYLNFYNKTFRYLRFSCTIIQSGAGSAGFRVYKVILVK